jgi:hypothetical protein
MRAFRENMGNGTVVFSDSALPVKWMRGLAGEFWRNTTENSLRQYPVILISRTHP